MLLEASSFRHRAARPRPVVSLVPRFGLAGARPSLGARLAARFAAMQGVFGSACGLRWAAAA